MAKQVDFVKTQVRIPQELHEQLKEAATSSNNSMNSEIIDRLAGSFSKKTNPEQLRDMSESMSDKMWASIGSFVDERVNRRIAEAQNMKYIKPKLNDSLVTDMLYGLLSEESKARGVSINELMEDIINKKRGRQ